MRILHIHDYPPTEGGGIEVNVFNLCRVLAGKGHDVQIGTSRLSSETYTSKSQSSYYSDQGVSIAWAKNRAAIKKLIDKADITHIHFTFSCRPAAVTALEYCTSRQKKCVTSIRTSIDHIPFSALSKLKPQRQQETLSKVSQLLSNPHVTLCSPARVIEQSLSRLKVNKKLVVVRNGIATNYTPKGQTFNKRVDNVDITFVGEISYLKGVNFLIEALAILKRDFPSIKARLIGNGQDMQKISHLAATNDLLPNVEFTGYILNHQLTTYLKRTKIVVHPSLTEVWPNVISETLSLGVPVVATSVGGIPEMTERGKYASLIPPANARALSRKLHQLLSNKANLSKLRNKAKKAKKVFTKRYTFENQASKLLKLYEQTIHG